MRKTPVEKGQNEKLQLKKTTIKRLALAVKTNIHAGKTGPTAPI